VTGPARLDSVLAEHWWAAVAAIARRTGDLEVAEDAVQEACAAAVVQWLGDESGSAGIPPNPRAWLITTAWHKAVDSMRRESRRVELEAETGFGHAVLARGDDTTEPHAESGSEASAWTASTGDDELALICACCHPALDLAARIALTLRCVVGLSTAEIAAAFVVPEPTIAQRIVRAKRKIRQAGIALTVPRPADLADRLGTVLRVVYLVFTQGHRAASGADLVRGDLCDRAVWLARQLAGALPGEPEVAGLLALLLLTDARRATRTVASGTGPRSSKGRHWSPRRCGRAGPVLISCARPSRPATARPESGQATDWRQIAALYHELGRFEPTPVVMANHAVAVAMAEGPSAGLAMLDRLVDDGRLDRWPPLYVARAELLSRLDRCDEARAAYQAALAAELPAAERAFIGRRIAELTSS
jgi:RNA polymerase sigma-70 factor (ECF subfamily)